MRTIGQHRRTGRLMAGVLATIAALACGDPAPTEVRDLGEGEPLDAATAQADVVEIEATGSRFSGPDEIPSGWTTVRLNNNSGMTHFAVLERMPDGYGLAEQQELVAPIFQEGMDLLNAGEFDAALATFGTLPAWFFDIVFLGGPGLIAPGRSAETTVFLEPGTYLLECYVKSGGLFHSYNPTGTGMVHEITVTAESSAAREPRPTIQVDVSTTNGFRVEGHVRPGRHTVAVNFVDQTVYEHFLGHDLHLARLEDGTDLDELAAWMNWTLPDGLETAAPAEFLGGVHEMPAGRTGYMNVLLTPGRYAWIGEVPDPVGRGMLQTFEVP